MLVEKYMKCELVKKQREQEMTDYITVRECTSLRSFLTPQLAPCLGEHKTFSLISTKARQRGASVWISQLPYSNVSIRE